MYYKINLIYYLHLHLYVFLLNIFNNENISKNIKTNTYKVNQGNKEIYKNSYIRSKKEGKSF